MPYDIASVRGHTQVCEVLIEMGTQSISIHYN